MYGHDCLVEKRENPSLEKFLAELRKLTEETLKHAEEIEALLSNLLPPVSTKSPDVIGDRAVEQTMECEYLNMVRGIMGAVNQIDSVLSRIKSNAQV